MFYDYNATVTSAHDSNPLRVVGNIKVYLDESKTTYLTEIPFPTFSFSDVEDKTVEGFETYVKAKVDEVVNSPEWQSKLEELKLAYEIGLYVPAQ